MGLLRLTFVRLQNANNRCSYGLFKAADKKMLKNEDLAAELGRPEKLVEM